MLKIIFSVEVSFGWMYKKLCARIASLSLPPNQHWLWNTQLVVALSRSISLFLCRNNCYCTLNLGGGFTMWAKSQRKRRPTDRQRVVATFNSCTIILWANFEISSILKMEFLKIDFWYNLMNIKLQWDTQMCNLFSYQSSIVFSFVTFCKCVCVCVCRCQFDDLLLKTEHYRRRCRHLPLKTFV